MKPSQEDDIFSVILTEAASYPPAPQGEDQVIQTIIKSTQCLIHYYNNLNHIQSTQIIIVHGNKQDLKFDSFLLNIYALVIGRKHTRTSSW